MKQAIINHFGGDYRGFYSKYIPKFEKSSNGELKAICPFHNDTEPSLNFNPKTGLFYCHGCSRKGDIFSFYAFKNNMDVRSSFPEVLDGVSNDFGIRTITAKSRLVKTYDYRDKNGKPALQVRRYEPGKNGKKKSFSQHASDGNGGWKKNLDGAETMLYNLPKVLKAEEVIFVEGEKDADNLNALRFTATTSPMGANAWRDHYSDSLIGKDVILIPDNEDVGRKHMRKVAQSLHGKAKSIKLINLPDLEEKQDVSDFIAKFNDREQASEILALMFENAEPYKDLKAINSTSFNTTDLMNMELPEPKWAIPDILPEGLTILGGKPKMGKSVLALNISIAVSSGGKALSKINVERGAVLYLALEDTKKRLQYRLKEMLQERPIPTDLYFETAWSKINDGGLVKLDKRIKEIPNLRLVIIDTLKKIRPIQKTRISNPYDIDYEDVAAIKQLADKHGIAILLIHHLRKSQSEDIMDDFSGTFGITGAADGLIAFQRKTGQADAELHIVGRDVDAAEYGLKYHPDIWAWELLGDASEVKSTHERQLIYDTIKDADEPLTPKEVSEISGVKYWTVVSGIKAMTADGSLFKTKYGKYRISAFF